MSMILDGSKPANTWIKTNGFDNKLHMWNNDVGYNEEVPLQEFFHFAQEYFTVESKAAPEVIFRGICFSQHDFLATVFYALTNTNLTSEDPRIAFLMAVKRTKISSEDERYAAVEQLKMIKTVPGWSVDEKTNSKRFSIHGEV